ncbi:MAG TPA: hypothetical protein VEI74_04250 [Candidatus Methylomirabilis sp.]|nr:hypothetical protein [Candidatus Methylomirabilis sp.]
MMKTTNPSVFLAVPALLEPRRRLPQRRIVGAPPVATEPDDGGGQRARRSEFIRARW